jgi:hypothetical protein
MSTCSARCRWQCSRARWVSRFWLIVSRSHVLRRRKELNVRSAEAALDGTTIATSAQPSLFCFTAELTDCSRLGYKITCPVIYMSWHTLSCNFLCMWRPFNMLQLQFVTSGMPQQGDILVSARLNNGSLLFFPNFLDEFKALSNMSLISEVNFILFT